MTQQPNLITLTDPHSPAAEAYRALRTNLIFATFDSPIEALVVAPVAPTRDKSRVAANLAVALAQGERRTILVDADLRRPELDMIFGVANERGLTTLMIDEAALADPPLVNVGVEGLRLLPSGPRPPNPADLLGSRRMERVIAALKAQADIVVFDAPPIAAVTDAVILSAKSDGVLLVASAGQTRQEHIRQAKELLERAHVRIIGAVLDKAPRGVTLGGY